MRRHRSAGLMAGGLPGEEARASGPKGPDLALAIGDRIEVLWTIERDDDDDNSVPKSEERWWGARVVRRSADSDDYTLLYDEYSEFPASEASVTLLGSRALIDNDANGEQMRWRREGDTSEVSDEDEALDGRENNAATLTPADKEAAVYSMRDVARAQDEVDAEQGESADAAMMEALGSLPTLQQSEMAVMYREFADKVKENLAQIVQERGAGYVVTEQDIRSVFDSLKSSTNSKVSFGGLG